MLFPPAAALHSSPTPNYTDPVTRGPALFITNIVFLALAAVAVFLRLYTRAYVRKWWAWDDAFVFAAFVRPPPCDISFAVREAGPCVGAKGTRPAPRDWRYLTAYATNTRDIEANRMQNRSFRSACSSRLNWASRAMAGTDTSGIFLTRGSKVYMVARKIATLNWLTRDRNSVCNLGLRLRAPLPLLRHLHRHFSAGLLLPPRKACRHSLVQDGAARYLRRDVGAMADLCDDDNRALRVSTCRIAAGQRRLTVL